MMNTSAVASRDDAPTMMPLMNSQRAEPALEIWPTEQGKHVEDEMAPVRAEYVFAGQGIQLWAP